VRDLVWPRGHRACSPRLRVDGIPNNPSPGSGSRFAHSMNVEITGQRMNQFNLELHQPGCSDGGPVTVGYIE